MDRDLDMDAFGAGEVHIDDMGAWQPGGPPPEHVNPLQAAIDAASASQVAAVEADPPPARTPSYQRKATPLPLAIMWPSQTAGQGHVVTLVSSGPVCTCEAAEYGNRCWAVKATIEIISERVVRFSQQP